MEATLLKVLPEFSDVFIIIIHRLETFKVLHRLDHRHVGSFI
jgi:hypothetical protein